MYKIWYDYVKPQYGEKAKLCYIDTDRFLVYIKAENIYVDISKDVDVRFDTSIYEIERPLTEWKKWKSNGLMNNELFGKIMTESAALKAKTHGYFTYGNDENKKKRGTKTVCHKMRT